MSKIDNKGKTRQGQRDRGGGSRERPERQRGRVKREARETEGEGQERGRGTYTHTHIAVSEGARRGPQCSARYRSVLYKHKATTTMQCASQHWRGCDREGQSSEREWRKGGCSTHAHTGMRERERERPPARTEIQGHSRTHPAHMLHLHLQCQACAAQGGAGLRQKRLCLT